MRTSLFFAILLLVNFNLFAQWESMNGPFGSYINDLGQNNHYVFAATTAGIYRSSDVGLNWTHISFTGDTRFACLQFDVHDSVLVADAVEIRPDTSIRRMYKSVDDGTTWVEIPRPPADGYVEIGVVGNSIFANDFNTIWITKDDGLQWKHSNVNHNLDYVGCFERYGSKVYVGSGEDLYVYEGYDNNWKKISISIAYQIRSVFVKDSLILVRDSNSEALYISEDNGSSWFSSPGLQWNSFPNYFAAIHDTLYATGFENIYVSGDHGHSWESRPSKAPHFELSLIAVDSTLLLGQQFCGMYRSTDFGRNFHFSSEGIDASYVQKLFLYHNQLLTGGTLQGVFNYSFENHQWQRTYLDEYFDAECFDFEDSNGHLVMAAYYVLWYEPSTGEWIKNSPEGYGTNRLYSDLYTSPFGLLAAGNIYSYGPMSIYKGFDNWIDFNQQFFDDTVSVHHFAQNAQCLFVATSSRVARTFGVGHPWEWMPPFIEDNTLISDLIALDNAVFVIQRTSDNAHLRLYVSYDNGFTWSLADNGIPLEDYYSGPIKLIEVGDYLVCCAKGSDGGVYISRKDKLQWESFNEGLPYQYAIDIISDGEYLYLANRGQGVWKRKVSDLNITSTQEAKTIHPSTLNIYPNPSRGQFYINLENENLIGSILKMYDLHGKLVFEKIIADPKSAIQIRDLPDGLYGVELKTNSTCYVAKLMVQ